jgi:hypothetical protein
MIKEEKEEWRTVLQNENYEISNLGQVRNKKTKKTRKKQINDSGYEIITLYFGKKKTYLVHRLVAQAFIPNPNNLPFVNHKDRNKVNNRITNLEWVTSSMNMKLKVIQIIESIIMDRFIVKKRIGILNLEYVMVIVRYFYIIIMVEKIIIYID